MVGGKNQAAGANARGAKLGLPSPPQNTRFSAHLAVTEESPDTVGEPVRDQTEEREALGDEERLALAESLRCALPLRVGDALGVPLALPEAVGGELPPFGSDAWIKHMETPGNMDAAFAGLGSGK